MSDHSTLSCSITSTDFSVPLGVEIRVDGKIVFDCKHVNQPIDFSYEFPDEEGDHVWEIELKNKTPEHTKLDSQGNIVDDVLLNIENIAIDGIELGHLAFEIAEYYHSFNSNAEISNNKFYGTMGCNGVVRLKFSSPIYIWLLNNL